MTYLKTAEEIHKYLIENNRKRVTKAEIIAMFNLNATNRTAIWFSLAQLGWKVYFSHLEYRT